MSFIKDWDQEMQSTLTVLADHKYSKAIVPMPEGRATSQTQAGWEDRSPGTL